MFMDMPPCVDQIAVIYQVPVDLIRAIRWREGGKLGQVVGPNRNGTYDHGPMQINSIWLDKIRREYGISKKELLHNYCTNVAVGTWILRQNYDEHRNWPDAIAAYNAGKNLRAGRAYSRDVMRKWDKLWSARYRVEVVSSHALAVTQP